VSLKPLKTLAALAVATLVSTGAQIPVAQAFGFGDMMNPSRWMGGGKNRDRYDDDYGGDYGGPWGGGPYGGPYGGGPYGGGPYGAPYGAPFGGGYGVPGYGAPAYGAPAPAAAPAQSSTSNQGEIDALKRRIEELESSQRQTQPAPSAEWPSAPAFRPMNQY
jgi:hypothetical protein